MTNTYPRKLTEFQMINVESTLARATEESLDEVDTLIQDIKQYRKYKAESDKKIDAETEERIKARK